MPDDNYNQRQKKAKDPEMVMPKEWIEAIEKASPAHTTEEKETAKSLGVTPAKLKAMREYTVMLKKADIKIKASTIRSRIAEKFKVKIT